MGNEQTPELECVSELIDQPWIRGLELSIPA